jgi:malate dehydrogenase
VPDVQKRGAAVIKARGASSAASAANAALDTLRSLHFPTPAGDWHSAAVLSKGDYGITPGIMFGYPLRTKADGSWEIVPGLPLDAFSKEKIAVTEKELLEERATASEALGLQL